jgi:hypothetical protein
MANRLQMFQLSSPRLVRCLIQLLAEHTLCGRLLQLRLQAVHVASLPPFTVLTCWCWCCWQR